MQFNELDQQRWAVRRWLADVWLDQKTCDGGNYWLGWQLSSMNSAWVQTLDLTDMYCRME